VRMPAGRLPSLPMEAARLFPEPAAGEPYTILIMGIPVFGTPNTDNGKTLPVFAGIENV
jgi:hypothetical protein